VGVEVQDDGVHAVESLGQRALFAGRRDGKNTFHQKQRFQKKRRLRQARTRLSLGESWLTA